ncbi:MAG: HDOD domain-containing protein [Marinobacter sp.]|uniref:EAL and HDOD domain-containing protein n=1 Tax=Marinobacter sp. TaxID=50741 RepID=UPI00299F300F|nr:HDOD domain-containing protein [Marinobacter sp.]MDX1635225.1 HDOD domain-containing protein [Marinobacter sp.]
MSDRSALLAAQPIFDREDSIQAVELLFRNDLNQSAVDVGENRATSELLFNLCTGITEQTEQYHSPAFINVSEDFLLSQSFLPIEPEEVVIELVERMVPTTTLVDAIRGWHRRGFRFALDDFEFTRAWDPILEFASIIKVDVLTTTPDRVEEHRRRLAGYDVQWLAERVEDEETRAAYRDLGFDLFQGYFYARPAIIYGRRLNPSAIQLARLIGLLFRDDPDIQALTDLISGDPGLAVSLLKVVNSPLYRAGKPITSLREVVVRLGIVNLRRWVMLFSSVSSASAGTGQLILTRAQACQELAQRAREREVDATQAFLVGLLSGVDVLLRVDQETFLETLDLDETIKAAVRQRSGPIGRVLEVVLKLERAVAMKQRLDRIDPRLLQLYAEAGKSVQKMLKVA